MAKAQKTRQRSGSRRDRVTPYPLPTCCSKVLQHAHQKKKRSKSSEKKEWVDATCSVCLEYPHNAVLLLCSSYHKGCRPYMCATSYRYSNCLDQYKKAYTKVNSTQSAQAWPGTMEEPSLSLQLPCSNENLEASELLCPLCRGQVKGWTLVEPARKYLNAKKRTCMQDKCSFVGTYKELRKHVKADHPWARPREVDPSLAEKWKKLENDRERNDVMSTISSTMPGSIVMGDYVIEGNFRGLSRDFEVEDYLNDVLFRLEPYGRSGNAHSRGLFQRDFQSWDDDEFEVDGVAPGEVDNFFSRIGRRPSRLLLGGSRRRRRRRPGNGGR